MGLGAAAPEDDNEAVYHDLRGCAMAWAYGVGIWKYG